MMTAFAEMGDDVVGIDDLSAQGSHLGENVRKCRVEDLQPDDVKDTEILLHLAASKRVDTSFTDLTSVGRNVQADAHIFELAYQIRLPTLVFASSCEVYGPHAEERGSAEDGILTPDSPYAVGKWASERILHTTRELFPATDVRIARLFNVYGEDEATTAVIPEFLGRVENRKPLVVHGSGQQSRDFNYIDDAVDMILRVCKSPIVPPVLNIGSGVATRICDVADIISTFGEGASAISYGPSRPNEVITFRSDTQLWRSSMGSLPSRSLEDGLRQCWMRRVNDNEP